MNVINMTQHAIKIIDEQVTEEMVDLLSGMTFEFAFRSAHSDATQLAIQVEIASNHVGTGWLIIDDDWKADDMASERFRESIWACNADHIAHSMPCRYDSAIADGIRLVQEKLCESANDFIIALLGDNVDECINEAIRQNGRGATLSSYDGEETEIVVAGHRFYAYRQA